MIRLGFLTLSFLVAFSQQDELQDFMDQAREDYKMLGMTIGAFKGNEWILRGQVGVRNADDPQMTLIGEDDKFILSDAGRSITAMLAARVVEQSQGMLSWNSTIAEVLGGSITIEPIFANDTLLDLLVLSGYIMDIGQVMEKEYKMDWYDQVWAASQWGNPEENMQQRLELTKFLVNVKCEEEGTCDKLTNSPFTYSVAVSMLEMFTGKTFDVLLEEEVFGPLGASNCGLGPTTLDTSLPPSQPWSHFSGPWGKYNIPILPGNQTNMPSSMAPDSGIHCSMDSWKNFLSAHLAKNETYLSLKNWQILQEPAWVIDDGRGGEIKYAPGFLINDKNPSLTTLYYTGDDQKDHSECRIFPEANLGIVMAVNTNMQGGMRQQVGMNKVLEFVENHINKAYGISIGSTNLKTL